MRRGNKQELFSIAVGKRREESTPREADETQRKERASPERATLSHLARSIEARQPLAHTLGVILGWGTFVLAGGGRCSLAATGGPVRGNSGPSDPTPIKTRQCEGCRRDTQAGFLLVTACLSVSPCLSLSTYIFLFREFFPVA